MLNPARSSAEKQPTCLLKGCKFRKCPSPHWAQIRVFQKGEKWLFSLWCLRYFPQKDSCMVLPFLIQNKVLNMIFQRLECFRQRDTEPFLKIGFAVALWVLKFYKMRNCPARQKSYIRLVSALVVRTHAWMGSWPLWHPTFLKRLCMFLQEGSVIIIFQWWIISPEVLGPSLLLTASMKELIKSIKFVLKTLKISN